MRVILCCIHLKIKNAAGIMWLRTKQEEQNVFKISKVVFIVQKASCQFIIDVLICKHKIVKEILR